LENRPETGRDDVVIPEFAQRISGIVIDPESDPGSRFARPG
jgi:hypothetical protein